MGPRTARWLPRQCRALRQASAESFEDVALRIDVEEGLAWCLHESVNVATGLVHARRALDLAEELGDPTVLAGALSHVAFLETLQGNGVALERIERAVAHDFPRNWSQILGRRDWVHGMLLEWAGDLPAAHERFEAAHGSGRSEHAASWPAWEVGRRSAS